MVAILKAAAGTSASSAACFSDFLKVVVQHASMANQTHLFRQFDVRRSDQSATPGTNDVIHRRPGILKAMVLRIDTLTQFDLPD